MDVNSSEDKVVGVTRGQSKYKKGGTAGIEGVLFQVDLLTVTLLNAFQNFKGWKLSTENKRYGKFDDVVLEFPDGAILLQAKHRKNKKLLFNELFSINSKNNDFSLGKYFFSYQEIKAQVQVKYVVICTNSDVNVEDDTCERFFNRKKDTFDSILYRFDDDCSFYTFNDSILPKLEEHARSYYIENLQGKNVDEGVITSENLSNFLNHLKFYSSYPSERDLNSVIEQLFSHVECACDLSYETSSKYIHSKMLDWFRQPQGIHLEDCHVKAMIAEMRSSRYCKELEKYNVFFNNAKLVFEHTKNILHVISNEWYLLNVLKIYRALQSNNKTRTDVLYVSSADSPYIQHAVEAFELPQYTHLIIIRPEIEEDSEIRKINLKLREILCKKPYKKIILVSNSCNRLASEISVNNDIYETMEEYISFKNLSIDTRSRLLKEKNVNFQGKYISLEELFSIPVLENCNKVLDPETMEKLIKSEKIKVGSLVDPLDKHTERYYVHRNCISFTDSKESEYEYALEIIEDNICNLEDKLILIAGSPGAGKSTMFTHLTVTIKETMSQLWVLRINLNEYTNALKDARTKNTTSVIDLLESLNVIKFRSQFERSIFSMEQRVLLMLDGVDEICPDYLEFVLHLIFQCREAPNFYKVLITTRQHVAKELEEKLNVKLLTLQSFTKEDQIHFLTNYWMHSFEGEEKRMKYEYYAKALVNKMASWMGYNNDDKNSFTAVPLQLRMLAEIFETTDQLQKPVIWSGCKQYLNAEEMNVADLYEMFIIKKRDSFKHMGNPSGTITADEALNKEFEESLDCHRSLALEEILGYFDCRCFSCYKDVDRNNVNANILKIGIVQQIGDGLHFMHRTFAEYFVAESVFKELKEQQTNPNRIFLELLTDNILSSDEHNVVRIFLNSFLRNAKNSLPYDIFRNCKVFDYRVILKEPSCCRDLIYVLAEDGCVEILRFLFNCIGFTNIPITNVNLLNCEDVKFPLIERKLFSVETLNYLKYLTDRGGVNIFNSFDITPLHSAVHNNHLKMVKFLLEHGANVNAMNSMRKSVLWDAVLRKNIDISKILIREGADVHTKNIKNQSLLFFTAVHELWPLFKLLVEKGADVNAMDSSKYAVLHIIVINSHLENVKLLVRNGADVNVRNSDGITPLHLAVLSNQLKIVKFLIQSGANVNIVDNKGCTALHMASVHGHEEIVKFLVEDCKVDINVVDSCDCTALNLAVAYYCRPVEAFLLNAGADKNIGNSSGKKILPHIRHILCIFQNSYLSYLDLKKR